MKRVLLLLAVMLAMSIVKAEEFEYDGLIYEVNENPNPADPFNPRKTLTVKKANGKIEGTLTIPAYVSYNGQELPVRRIGERAFMDNEQLTGVNFPDMLQYIDDHAFYGTGILSLDLSQTRVRKIGYYAFGGCKNLSDVKLPTGGTNSADLDDAFGGCDAIKSLIVPPGCRVFSLPPKIEELYTVSVYNIMYGYQSDVDLTKVVLHVPKDEMQFALETFGDKCKGYKVWDFEVVNRIEPDLTGFETENFYDYEWCEERTVFYATVGKPTRLSFKIFPEDALFKSVYVDMVYADLSLEYDGEDTVIFTMNSLVSYCYNKHIPIRIFSVRVAGANYSMDTHYDVYVFQNPDPDYPVSIGFKHPQVRIKPFEFYYQPVEFYPEGSTILPVTWQSSDPAIATVTKDGKVYPLVEEGTVEIMATATGYNGNLSASYTAIIDKNAAAVDDIFIDEDSNRIYYNLQGIKVAEENLTPGIYIVVNNGRSKKIVIR